MKYIELIKKHYGLLLITLTILLATSLNFYWTKYRPMIATKDCAKVAQENIKNISGIKDIDDFTKTHNFLLNRCLSVGYGINK
jgi:hypothetical protein